MCLHLFKKNPNQSCPEKMINKYVKTLDVLFKYTPWCKHKHDINIFWSEKTFLKRNKQRQSLICLKNCEMNNFLAMLEFCAFYIGYKNEKFTGVNFRRRTNVKYFMQTQLLRFCQDTAKVSPLPLLKTTTKSPNFSPAKKKIAILWIELQTNKMQNLTSKHRAVKKSRIAKPFRKMWIKKQHNFSKNKFFFFTVVFCLFTCTNQWTKNELFR